MAGVETGVPAPNTRVNSPIGWAGGGDDGAVGTGAVGTDAVGAGAVGGDTAGCATRGPSAVEPLSRTGAAGRTFGRGKLVSASGTRRANHSRNVVKPWM